MNLRTYTASSMADALAKVKRDLGKDAVILHTRVYRTGQVMGMGGRQVVEITASDQAGARRGPQPARPAEGVRGFEPTSFPIADRRDGEAAQPAATPAVAAKSAAAPAPAAGPHPVPRLPDVGGARPTGTLSVRVEAKPQDGAAAAELRDELASIKRLVGQVLHASRRQSVGAPAAASLALTGGLPDAVFERFVRLQDAGLSIENADHVLARVREDLARTDLSDPQAAHSAFIRNLAMLIPTVGSLSPAARAPDGRPHTIALVGPTGVGKTTTIAKLAAAYKLRHAKRVGLVTCDTYRIAAVDQLRTYANIIGLPLKVAMTVNELQGACESLRDCDVILLDTAGRSQNDSARLDELSELVAAAKPHETHLVLSAAMAESVLTRTSDRFARLRPDRVIVTKLDEAVQFGPLVNVVRRVGLRMSFVTTGQEVPDQIELACADRFARLVLDGTHGSGESQSRHEALAMML